MLKRKVKWKNIVILLITIILLITFIISTINIIKWLIDSNKTNNQIEEIQNIVNIDEVSDNKNTEIIKQENIPKSNPY